MIENLAWEYFKKTGNIDGYLLYKETASVKENGGAYGTNQNERGYYQTNTSERQ